MTKSVFMNSAEQMRDKLGNGMCLAKWQQVSLHLPTGLNNSCYHPPLHEIDAAELKDNPGALHNTKHKKQQRKIMIKQERPDECSYCWTQEDMGNLSDRHYRSGEPWAAEHFDRIMESTGDEDEIPSYVEVNFNNACNLKCSYCSPQFSSSWADEIKRFGAYPTSKPHNAPEHFEGRRRPIPAREENPYVEAFWKWWPELYPKLKHFRMTGGEPLMDRNTFKVFDYVLAFPKPDLHIDVTSNFSVDEKLWSQYLDYVQRLCETNIEHFMQYVSIDSGISEHAHYIRHGADYWKIMGRCESFLAYIPNRNSLTFIITMNNLNILGLQELLQSILRLRAIASHTYQRVWFDTPILRQPTWQSLQILPPVYADRLATIIEWMELHKETEENMYVGFKDYEIARMRRVLDWMREGSKLTPEYVKLQRADFYRFFNEQDLRRDTNFLATFPQMKEFWEECRYHAHNG